MLLPQLTKQLLENNKNLVSKSNTSFKDSISNLKDLFTKIFGGLFSFEKTLKNILTFEMGDDFIYIGEFKNKIKNKTHISSIKGYLGGVYIVTGISCISSVMIPESIIGNVLLSLLLIAPLITFFATLASIILFFGFTYIIKSPVNLINKTILKDYEYIQKNEEAHNQKIKNNEENIIFTNFLQTSELFSKTEQDYFYQQIYKSDIANELFLDSYNIGILEKTVLRLKNLYSGNSLDEDPRIYAYLFGKENNLEKLQGFMNDFNIQNEKGITIDMLETAFNLGKRNISIKTAKNNIESYNKIAPEKNDLMKKMSKLEEIVQDVKEIKEAIPDRIRI